MRSSSRRLGGGRPAEQSVRARDARAVRAALLAAVAIGVALTVGLVNKGCSWLQGGSGPAWMDLSASTNSEAAVRILEPGAR